LELNDAVELLNKPKMRRKQADEKLTEVAMSLYESAGRKKKTRRN